MSSSPIPQRALGGSASHIKVGQIGFGLMGMTWCPSDSMSAFRRAFLKAPRIGSILSAHPLCHHRCLLPISAPDAQAFEAMKAAVDAGANLWNSEWCTLCCPLPPWRVQQAHHISQLSPFTAGAFYGPPVDPYANLKLIARFFDAHKDYIPKVVLCVKGGARIKTYSEKSQLIFDANEDNLREDLQEIRKYLKSDQGGHDVDLYEMARKDVKVRSASSSTLILPLTRVCPTKLR